MKKIIIFGFLFAAISICIFSSCNKQADSYLLKIDFQTDFSSDSGSIYIDNQLVFNEQIQSNPLLGFAASYSDTISSTTHTVRIVVNQDRELNFAIKMNSDQYVGIIYNRSNGVIKQNIQKSPFLYD